MCTAVTDGPDILLTMAALTMAPAVITAATGAFMLLFLIVVSLVAGPENAATETAFR